MSREKTEQPTQKRLREARKKGQVAKSREISSCANVIGIFLFLWIFVRFYLEGFKSLIKLGEIASSKPFTEGFRLLTHGVIVQFTKLVMPLVILAILLGVASNFFQIGLLFAFESIKPDLKKINPLSAAKRIFSKKNLIEFIKSIVKIIFLVVLFYIVFKRSLPGLITLPYGGIAPALDITGALLKKLIVYTSIVFIVVAAADYFFQKFQHTKELMMTKEEVKQEYKEMEGDPLIKSKRRQLHQELVTTNMLENVRKSTVVVTNPIRLAIALYYDEDKTKLPVIMAKGENLLAKRMVEIAQAEGIPVMINVPLAQDLYKRGNLDDYIPSDLIEPVAEVLKWVFKLKKEYS